MKKPRVKKDGGWAAPPIGKRACPTCAVIPDPGFECPIAVCPHMLVPIDSAKQWRILVLAALEVRRFGP